MLIVCPKLLIYKKREKGEGVYFRYVLYVMYKEYKADEYNAEITGTREQLNVRLGNCWRFLTGIFIQVRKKMNTCSVL